MKAKEYFANVKREATFKHMSNYILVIGAMALFLILQACGAMTRSLSGLLCRIGYSVILAVSLNLVVGFLGELSLGHAGFMCVGAYLGCVCSNFLANFIRSDILLLVIALIVGAAVAALFGFIIGLPALRLKGDYLAIVTLAFGEIVRNICKNLDFLGGNQGLTTRVMPAKQLWIVSFVVLIIMLFLIQNLIRSKHGRAITAIRDSEIAARAMGVNVTYYKLFVFVFSAAFAGMAGVLYGFYTTPLLPTFFSYNYSIEILVMVVLGGIGSIGGSIIAASLLTYLNFALQNALSGELASLKYLFYAIILILVVLYNNAPGLAGLREKLNIRNIWRKLFSRKTPSPKTIRDDEAAWHRISTKIKMDEILSVDTQPGDTFAPDKPGKEDR